MHDRLTDTSFFNKLTKMADRSRWKWDTRFKTLTDTVLQNGLKNFIKVIHFEILMIIKRGFKQERMDELLHVLDLHKAISKEIYLREEARYEWWMTVVALIEDANDQGVPTHTEPKNNLWI